MAIDTQNKRCSVTGIMPVPDGSIDAADRAQAARIYAGLTYGLPAAYVYFDEAKPDPDNQRTSDINAMRTNLSALRDALIFEDFYGFNYSWSGGTAEEPTCQFYKDGNDWLRLTIIWSGGNPASILYELSTDGGVNYETIGTQTFTWDAEGNLSSTAWS
jgi:hypothetical protein